MPNPKGSLKVSIIIPALNEEKLIGSCLREIIQNTNNDTEIILVDNGSTDDTLKVARSFPNVKVFEEKRKGVMYARQRGVEESSGDIVAFIDADVRIKNGWREKIIKQFTKDSSLVCLTGPYEYYDLSEGRKYLMAFYWHTFVYIAYAILGYIGNFGNMAIRRDALQKMGGLDTSIVFYGDDTATAKSISKFGRVKYDLTLSIQSSGRRFAKEGLTKTCIKYAANFFSQILFKKSVTKKYEEFR